MTAFVLKMIACIAMLIDHTAAVFESQLTQISPWLYIACRMIGRLAFPIFALGIAEGAVHTKSPRKYLLKMLIFAVIAQIPFSLMLGAKYSGFTVHLFGQELVLYKELSVMATLFLGLVACLGVEKKKPFFTVLALFAAFALDKTIGMDYGFLGVLLIFALYLARSSSAARFFAVIFFSLCLYLSSVASFAKCLIMGGGQFSYLGLLYCAATMAAGFLILAYNKKLGRKSGMFFYAFYPIHMLALWLAWFLLVK